MKHIQLSAAEPRCRNRANVCDLAGKCARARAALPQRNATVADFSLELLTVATPFAIVTWCGKYEGASFDAAPAEKPAAKPWIGEAA